MHFSNTCKTVFFNYKYQPCTWIDHCIVVKENCLMMFNETINCKTSSPNSSKPFWNALCTLWRLHVPTSTSVLSRTLRRLSLISLMTLLLTLGPSQLIMSRFFKLRFALVGANSMFSCKSLGCVTQKKMSEYVSRRLFPPHSTNTELQSAILSCLIRL